MAEAEDVITDVARHATVFVQNLWRRHRPLTSNTVKGLEDLAPRLDLLIAAVFGKGFRLRPAQPPAPRTWLDKLIRRHEAPVAEVAIPMTDGVSIWLPRSISDHGGEKAIERYRIWALQQATRAIRGSANYYPFAGEPAIKALYHIFEARAADDQLARMLPGAVLELKALRCDALATRPPARLFPSNLRAVEELVLAALSENLSSRPNTSTSLTSPFFHFPLPATPREVLAQAHLYASTVAPEFRHKRGRVLFLDRWLGDFAPPPKEASDNGITAGDRDSDTPIRTGRLARRPQVRTPVDDEDAQNTPGAMMVQTAQPHEQAEDPMGLQRPVDRDTETAADEYADALSELPEARLVTAPGTAREVLLSDDPPDGSAAKSALSANTDCSEVFLYPEWDWRAQSYVVPGTTVTVSTAALGTRTAVDAILTKHASMLHAIRRHFELLRSQRTRLRHQLDGDEIDIQGWIDNQAMLGAGGQLDQRLYQTERRARRDMAVSLLVDISGSTDSWVSGQSRVIDVEREALLLVCVALQGLGEPFNVLGFSGEGRSGVVIRLLKRFEEQYKEEVSLRIAGIEPETYTRAGAALRHATAELMHQAAEHRLLILLSDGRPNDMDLYDGRYGVEDLRQAVVEARLQGISPFCLTVDRQAANYLPGVFGNQSYSLLQSADMLPNVLLTWLQKLVTS